MTARSIHGRDIAELLAPQGAQRQNLPGFDADYADIVDYIIRCTHRIWEQKDVGLIATHYAPDIVVHTMTGPVVGMDGVIAGTARTLSAFPDRTLIGEAVIWSDEGDGAYLSSHRITSIATNTGQSELGPATGRRIAFTTIADCLCKANLIVEEWLVRDYSAMALGLGYCPRAIAQDQAEADRAAGPPARWRSEAMEEISAVASTPFPDGPMAPVSEPEDFAHGYFDRALNHRRFGTVRDVYLPAVRWYGPGGRRLFGHGEVTGWLTALIGTFGDLRVRVDHVAAVGDEIAVRWSAAGTHDGGALYGAASGRPVYILAVTHWRLAHGMIAEETTIFDEVALLRQIEGGL
ncbi:MAG: ester cyclase [Novosphingobium sp.]|nr:ester cyclase [Novosphingobium sp.]